MNLRSLSFSTLILVLSSHCIGQTKLIENDAKWVYAFFTTEGFGFELLENSNKEVNIEGENFIEFKRKKIYKSQQQNATDTLLLPSLYFKEEGRKIYQYTTEKKTIYDYNLKTGDSVNFLDLVYYQSYDVDITVSQVGKFEFNNDSLKYIRLQVNLPTNWFYPPQNQFNITCLEKIGATNAPYYINSLSDPWLDFPRYYLCEYSNGQSNYYGTHPYCEYYYQTLSSASTIENNEIKIYPNPCSDFVVVNLKTEGNSEIKIYNSEGKLFYQGSPIYDTYKIDTSEFREGLYFLRITNIKTGHQTIQSFVKAL